MPINKKVNIAIIGPSRGDKGIGIGAIILDTVLKNHKANLFAIGGSNRKNTLKILKSIETKYNKSDVLFYSLDKINQLFLNNNIDLIIIASPDYTHYEYMKLAVLNKRHVLVDKPIIDLDSTKNNDFPYLLKKSIANKKYISLLSQRANIVNKLESKTIKNSLSVGINIGTKNIPLNSRKLFRTCISHPISILVKLGLDDVNIYNENIINYLNTDTFLLINVVFKYQEIKCRIFIKQFTTQYQSSISLKIDENEKIVAEAEELSGKYYTKYTLKDKIVYEEELVSLTIDKMIRSINGDSEPLISNTECLKIHNIESFLYNKFIEINKL